MKSISRPSFHILKVFKEGSTGTVISKDNLNQLHSLNERKMEANSKCADRDSNALIPSGLSSGQQLNLRFFSTYDLMMLTAQENFNLKTKGFSPKPKYVIINVPSRNSLQKRIFPSKWGKQVLYPDTFKADGSQTEVDRFQLRTWSC